MDFSTFDPDLLGKSIDGVQTAPQKPHESKPFRAFGASLVSSIPNTFFGLPGLAIAGAKTLLNDKSFGENAANTSALQAANKISDSIHDFFGANREGEKDTTEKWASFLGEAVPTIGTGGGYGIVKAPNLVAKTLGKSAKRAATKEFRKVATKEMNKFTTKDLRFAALHEANRGKGQMYNDFLKSGITSGPKLAPSKGVARLAAEKAGDRKNFALEMLLPGYQVSKTEHLMEGILRPELMTAQSLQKALRKAHAIQATELGIQAGVDIGLQEMISAYNDTDGLIGDYRDSLDHELHKQTSTNLLPAALGMVGVIAGYGAMRRFGQVGSTEFTDIVNKYKNSAAKSKLENVDIRNLPTIKQTSSPSATNFWDKTAFMDDVEFRGTFNDLDKANMRYDTRTTINSTLATGYPNVEGPNIKPLELHKNLTDLHTYHPDDWKLIEDYLDTNDKIASISDTINKEINGVDAFEKYQSTNGLIERKAITELDNQLQDLNKISIELRKKIDVNPTLRKIIDDIQLDSKIRLQNAVKSGRMTQNVADYLTRNRTINGYFSYRPFIEETVNTGILDKAKRVLFEQEYLPDTSLMNLGRIGRDLSKVSKSYTDTYLPTVMSELQQMQKNARSKAVIMSGLKNQYEFLGKLDATLQQNNAAITELAERLSKHSSVIGEEQMKALKRQLKKNEMKAYNLSHIEYVGTKKAQKRGEVVRAKTPYAILNPETPPDLPHITNINGKRHTEDIVKTINNAKSSKDIVSFYDTNGDEHFFRVTPIIKSALDFSPSVPDAFGMAMLNLKRVKTETTTGSWNPMFAFTSLLYGFEETIAALPRILSGKLTLKEAFDNVKFTGQAIKMQITRDFKQTIVNNWKEEMVRTYGDMSQSPMSKLYSADQIAKMENDIEDCLLTRFEKAGAVTYRYPEGLNGTQYPLSIDLNLSEKLKNKLINIHGARMGIQCFKFLGYCTDALRNASTVGALIHLNAKKAFKDTKEIRLAADKVATFVTDSKKSGLHVGVIGSVLGSIGKYMPYGRIGINSIATKLAALNVNDGIAFLKGARKEIQKSHYSVGEIAHMVKLGATGALGNQYLQALYLTACVPVTVAYLWNHCNQENKEDYYRLSDFDKSSKIILANFYGKGNHLTIPLDQEIGVGGKLYETMLDSILNLSKDNGVDPAFQQSRVLAQALARSLNIENMVFPEAVMNIAGYKTNLEYGQEFSGLVSKLPQNVTNLDGSQTALQDGVFSQEATALMNTLFGAVGSSLVRGVEAANIGIRDNGISKGLQDFVAGQSRSSFRPIPFGPNDRMTYKSLNQTARDVKSKIDTIDKLRKLNTFNSTDTTMVGKSGAKVALDSAQKQLDPSLQFASIVAQTAVPYYNQKIKPIYDKISGIYKQIAAYNATGRDVNGNVVGVVDRWKYQQEHNKQIQDIYKQLYFEFDKLEKLLTLKYKRDINLSEFNNLQGG